MNNYCPICILITDNINQTQDLRNRFHTLATNAEDQLLDYIVNTLIENFNSIIIEELRSHVEELFESIELFNQEIDFFITLHQNHMQQLH